MCALLYCCQMVVGKTHNGTMCKDILINSKVPYLIVTIKNININSIIILQVVMCQRHLCIR